MKLISIVAELALSVASDGCCVHVTASGEIEISATGMTFIAPTGSVSFGGGVSYSYCWHSKESELAGSFRGNGTLGVNVGSKIKLVPIKVYLEGGIVVGGTYSFSSRGNDQKSIGVGLYGKFVFQLPQNISRVYQVAYGTSGLNLDI